MRHTKAHSSAAALALCLAAVVIGGCRSNPLRHAAPSSLPQAAETTGQAATVVREAANSIGEANAEIQAAVPEVAPQTSQIAAGVDRLRAVEESLSQTKTALAIEAVQAKETAAALTKANARIAQLEERNEFMREAGDQLWYVVRHAPECQPQDIIDACQQWADKRRHG